MFGMKKKGTQSADPKPVQPTKYPRNRGMIMLGLALGMLLAALDQTIVGTSLPTIVAELGGMSLFSWLFTAYLLAETVTIPIAGKMSDRYGRKPVFLAGMGLFLGGSILAGMSQSMEMLIACRFIQGLGGGALMPVSMATVADLYAPTERGKIQGLLGAIFALASIIGPFIGGWIVDNASWRWVFYVNMPVGALAIIFVVYKFPRLQAAGRKSIDYLGIASLTAALVTGLLAITWGGATYPWDSVQIVGLALASLVSSVLFVLIEKRAEDPILPLHLFREPIFTFGSVALMLMAVGLFGVISYLPFFLQAVIGMSATYSGEVLIPLMGGAIGGSILSGFLLKRTGYKIWLITGPLLAAAGLFLMSTMHVGSSVSDAVIYLVIAGLGLGFVMSNYIVAAQNVVSRKEMGVATSAMSLFRGLGATIGVAVLGTIVNRQMVIELGKSLPEGASQVLPSTDVNTLSTLLLSHVASTLPTEITDAIRVALSNSITYMFLIGMVFVLVAWVVSLFIKSVPLKTADDYHSDSGTAEAAVSEDT